MPKLLVAGPGEYLACKKCGARLDSGDVFSEDGSLDFKWCEACCDFVDSKVVKGDREDGIDKSK